MLYIVGGGAITAALICIMTDWEGIEYPGALLFAGIVIGFIGFWFRTGTSIQGAVGLLFYFISLLCFIGVWPRLQTRRCGYSEYAASSSGSWDGLRAPLCSFSA
jgi:hypothetical protein